MYDDKNSYLKVYRALCGACMLYFVIEGNVSSTSIQTLVEIGNVEHSNAIMERSFLETVKLIRGRNIYENILVSLVIELVSRLESIGTET